MHLFSPEIVGNTDNGDFEHRRVRGNHILNLDRVHVLRAGNDHVFLAVDQIQVPGRVEISDIAGMIPPAAQGFRRHIRLPPILLHDLRAAENHFADLADRHIVVVGIDHPKIDQRRRRAARCSPVDAAFRNGQVMVLRVKATRNPGGFGNSIGVQKQVRGKHSFRFLQHPERRRRAAIHDLRQARQIVFRRVGMVGDERNQRCGQRCNRDALLFDQFKYAVRLEMNADLRCADHRHRPERERISKVEHRGRVQPHRPQPKIQGRRAVDAAPEDIRIGQAHALWIARRAGRMSS